MPVKLDPTRCTHCNAANALVDNLDGFLTCTQCARTNDIVVDECTYKVYDHEDEDCKSHFIHDILSALHYTTSHCRNINAYIVKNPRKSKNALIAAYILNYLEFRPIRLVCTVCNTTLPKVRKYLKECFDDYQCEQKIMKYWLSQHKIEFQCYETILLHALKLFRTNDYAPRTCIFVILVEHCTSSGYMHFKNIAKANFLSIEKCTKCQLLSEENE